MTKNHLKRIAAPKSWLIKRKESTFITKPKPGAHSLITGFPISVLLRDLLQFAYNMKEVKYILHNKEVYVNGRRVKDNKYIVGLMDLIYFKDIDKYYRILFNEKGYLYPKEISKSLAIEIYKINNKTKVKGGKVQLNLHNGYNLLVDNDEYKTGDSIVVDKNNKQRLEFKKGAYIHLIGGAHIGVIGKIEDIKEDKIIFRRDNETFETLKKYAFVVGDDKLLI